MPAPGAPNLRSEHPGSRPDDPPPGRCEPGTGEINYAGIARALIDLGYAGVVGLESFASGDPAAALAAFRAAFGAAFG